MISKGRCVMRRKPGLGRVIELEHVRIRLKLYRRKKKKTTRKCMSPKCLHEDNFQLKRVDSLCFGRIQVKIMEQK